MASDVAAIDAILVPGFQAADRGAIVAQNRWARRELGLLVLSGLLVTASSVQAAVQEEWAGVLVAALGGLSSVLAGTSRSTDARGAYLRARREAERLRSLAWTHLSMVEPDDSAARTRALRRGVARIRLQTVEGSDDTEPDGVSGEGPQPTMVLAAKQRDPSSERLVDLYLAGRVDAQRAWYRRRQEEFDAAERQGGQLRTVLLIVATVLGSISAFDLDGPTRAALAVAATVTTAASAIITGWMRLQAFDMRARLYELTAARLDFAEAERPPRLDPALAAQYIGECEDVLLAEHGAWTSQTPRGAREPSPGPNAAS
jgi:hypothetical protein